MIKKIMVLPAIVLSLSLSQSVFSHESDKMQPAHNRLSCVHQMMQKLALTSDQKTKIHALKDQAINELRGKRQELRSIRQQMRPLIETDTLDEAKLDTLIAQKKNVIASLTKRKIMLNRQVYALLDEKQKTIYTDLAKQCDEMRTNH